MGAPIWLRTCLTKMAVSNVLVPMQVCLVCGKSLLDMNSTAGRSGHVLRRGQFMSVVSKDRALQGQSAACKSLAYPKTVETVMKEPKRKKALKANQSCSTEDKEESLQITTPETESNDDQFHLNNIIEEIDIGDEEMAHTLAEMTGTIRLTTDVPVATTSVCVGIDPDLSGAIAVLRTRDNSTVAEVIDVPCVIVTVNKRKRRRHDYQSISTLVRQLRAPEGSIAYVEQAMPFPKDGKQGWYITGYGYGVWLGILAAAGFTVVPVQARVWKTSMGLFGKEYTKDSSRALASSMFPVLSSQLQRKKDHGRAEALLIAAFGKGMTLTNISPIDEPPSPNGSSSSDEAEDLTSTLTSDEPPSPNSSSFDEPESVTSTLSSDEPPSPNSSSSDKPESVTSTLSSDEPPF